MANQYQLKNTAGDKTITILPLKINGSLVSTADSDVNLIGQGTTQWGSDFNESLYHIVESFACPEKSGTPGIPQDEGDLGTGLGVNNPIPGQFWFNTTTNKTMVFANQGGSPNVEAFQSINGVIAGTSAPALPILGDLWYDETLPQLKIYDGAAFTSTAERYLLLDGTSPMTGDLDAGGNAIVNVADIVGGSPAFGNQAANKNYVDQEINTLTGDLNGGLLDPLYVNVSGDTMTGQLKGITPVAAEDLTRLDFVEAGDAAVVASSVQKPGSAVTGNLMEFDASDNAVDSGITAGAVSTPTGTVQMFAGITAPSGYLLCNSASVSTTTYADLFAIIGYTYGGSGALFNVPDFRGRVPAGVGTTDPVPSNGSGTVTLAQKLGQWFSKLTSVNHLPSHNHGGGSHTHKVFDNDIAGARSITAYPSFAASTNRSGIGASEYNIGASTSTVPDSGVTSAVSNVSSQGASSAFNTYSPMLGINFIIKT